jgi:hypothetical protein
LKIYYNPEKDILGLLTTKVCLKIQKDMKLFMVLTDAWIEVGEL